MPEFVESGGVRILRAGLLISVIGLFLGPGFSHAEDSADLHPLLTDGVSIDLGIFYPDRNLNLRVDGTLGPNDEIAFDEQFKLGNPDEVFSGELAWRFRDNWSLLAQYFKTSDSNSVTLSRDIEWRDIVFTAGVGVKGGTDLSLTRLFVGRQLGSDNARHDLGLGGGIHWLSIGSFIEGTIFVDGISRSARRSVSSEAPLPNLGAWYRYSISPRLAFRMRYDLLSASVGEYDGVLQNGAIGFNYRLFDHFGVGIAYNFFELDVKVDRNAWRGKVETIYDGAYIYASAYF